MGKKLILLSCLLMFANYAFAQHQSKSKIKPKSNRIVEILKTAKEVVCGTNADFNRKAKVLFYKACNPSLFFYKKTEYVDLVKAINYHNVDKLDVLIEDYNLTPQAKQILLNHADRVIASLEKEIIDENTLVPVVVAPPAAPTVGTPVPVSLNAPAQQQPVVVDNSPKVDKSAFALITAIALYIYSKEEKAVNHNLMPKIGDFFINGTWKRQQAIPKQILPHIVQENIYGFTLDDVRYKLVGTKMIEERDANGNLINQTMAKDSKGNILYLMEPDPYGRKPQADISYWKPLKNTMLNPVFLIPLLIFANSELVKRLEYRKSNKKVAVLPKALAIRDLILNASTKSVME